MQDYLRARGYGINFQVCYAKLYSIFQGNHPGCPICPPVIAIKVQTLYTQECVERSYREIENMRILKDLPHVVQLLESFYEPLSPTEFAMVLVMEWVDKDLMSDMLDRSTSQFPWTEAELWSLSTQLIETLAEMERRGVVHRDINPRNIFLDVENRAVKLGDFGSSRVQSQFEDPSGSSVIGTLLFMSHELKEGIFQNKSRIEHHLVKSDVYSLGVTILMLATLKSPEWLFSSKVDENILFQEIGAISYSDFMKQMIWEMMDLKVESRFTFTQLEAKYCQLYLQNTHDTDHQLSQIVEEGKEVEYQSTEDSAMPSVPSNELQQYVPLSPESSPLQSTTCCFCGGTTAECKSLEMLLSCPFCGFLHFCDRNCLISYIESITSDYSTKKYTCPKCSVQTLSEDSVICAYGGKESFMKRVAEVNKKAILCVSCWEREADSVLECDHMYCFQCIEAYKTSYFTKRRVICAACDRVSVKWRNTRDY